MAETKDIIARDSVTTVRSAFKKNASLINELLPKHINQSTFVRIATNTIVTTPKLLDADFKTLFRQVLQCGVLGLMPDSIMGLAYLVPFYNSKRGKYDVQLIIGYKGLIELAMRTGKIRSIGAEVVYQNEPFSISLGTDRRISHTPLPPSERGDTKGCYAYAQLQDGSHEFQFLFKEDIEKFREKSSSAWDGKGDSRKLREDSVWVQYEEAMWKKTAIRQLCKYLPMSQELTRAVAYDEASEAGIEIQPDFTVEDEQPTYGIKSSVIEELNKMYDELGVNQAQRAMEIAKCDGDAFKVAELVNRLTRKLAKAKEPAEEKSSEAKTSESPDGEELFGKA